MSDDTVLEVKATAELTIHLPMSAGDNVSQEVEEVLAEEVRWVDSLDIKEVYPIEEY